MKLVLCMACHDIIRLVDKSYRECACHTVGGRYSIDGIHAFIFGGKSAVPLFLDNSSFAVAVSSRTTAGLGSRAEFGVIPRICPTVSEYDTMLEMRRAWEFDKQRILEERRTAQDAEHVTELPLSD